MHTQGSWSRWSRMSECIHPPLALLFYVMPWVALPSRKVIVTFGRVQPPTIKGTRLSIDLHVCVCMKSIWWSIVSWPAFRSPDELMVERNTWIPAPSLGRNAKPTLARLPNETWRLLCIVVALYPAGVTLLSQTISCENGGRTDCTFGSIDMSYQTYCNTCFGMPLPHQCPGVRDRHVFQPWLIIGMQVYATDRLHIEYLHYHAKDQSARKPR